MATLRIAVNDDAERAAKDRAQRMAPRSAPAGLSKKEHAILFLRSVSARASTILPAFYLFVGANGREACAVTGYPGEVLRHTIAISSAGTMSLACRFAFDHGSKGLTGVKLGQAPDAVLEGVADYWSSPPYVDSRSEALAALGFLRSVFQKCAKSDRDLLRGDGGLLGRRIGLLKQHADHSVAHVTTEGYEFSTLDCAHVVAALTMIGEIVRCFDEPTLQADYFNKLDEASLAAAKHLFPTMPDLRLFQHIHISQQARGYWKLGGLELLLEELPHAIGWY